MANGNPIDPKIFNVAGDVNPLMKQLDGGSGSAAGLSQMLQNPLFLSFIADIGSRLDPQGFGGAVGGATKEAIQASAVQKALSQQKKKRGTDLESLIEALGDTSDGISKIELHPEGTIKSITGATPTSGLAETSAPTSEAGELQEMKPVEQEDIFDQLSSGKITGPDFMKKLGQTTSDLFGDF